MIGHWLLRLGSLALVVPLAVLGSVLPAPADQPAIEIHDTRDADFGWRPDRPVFVLVVGNDFRPGVGGERADAIHLIGLNPGAGAGAMVNIPRDTWATIPGRGRGKINAANAFGGPALQAATIEALTGIRPDFVVMTDFAGFVGMVDELGGVPVDVPIPMADSFSGAYFDVGRVRMSGQQALAFARNRHIPDGDFRRTLHQGVLILSGLEELRTRGTSPTDALRYIGVFLRHAEVHGVDLVDLYRLGRLALSIDPGAVRNVTMPGRVGAAGGQSVVLPVAPARELFADLAADGLLQHF